MNQTDNKQSHEARENSDDHRQNGELSTPDRWPDEPRTVAEPAVKLTVELHRPGAQTEILTVEYDGDLAPYDLAHKLAAVLELEAQELLRELREKPGTLDHERRHCRLELSCIDVHFETEAATHKFLATSTWERVHRWSCHHFKVAADTCANLELHDGTPTGPALNESKQIGNLPGCHTVWLVKPGPERNGR